MTTPDNWSKESYRSGQHALTTEELEKVVLATRNFTEMVLIKLAAASGIRRGDIVKLRWTDLDYEKGRLTFYEQKKRRTRSVYLSKSLLSDLRRLQDEQKNSPYLFPGSSDPKYGKGHLSDRSAYNIFNRALAASGLDKRPFHALRATCIKLAQAKGWTTSQAAEHVGDSIRVIETHYMAPSDGEMRAAAREKPIL